MGDFGRFLVIILGLSILHTCSQPQHTINRLLNCKSQSHQIRVSEVGNGKKEQATNFHALRQLGSQIDRDTRKLCNTHKIIKPSIAAAVTDCGTLFVVSTLCATIASETNKPNNMPASNAPATVFFRRVHQPTAHPAQTPKPKNPVFPRN
jgi:hypothetical protein